MWFLLAKSVMVKSKIPHIILNVIRALNSLAIIASATATGSLLVKTANVTVAWFNIFDLAAKAFIILFATFLLVTELPKVLRGWINRNWPAFGNTSGFLSLGVCLTFLGCIVLSYLTKEDADEKHLGGDYYRLCEAAGLMTIIMGHINLVATLVLRDRRRGLSARQVRATKGEFDDLA